MGETDEAEAYYKDALSMSAIWVRVRFCLMTARSMAAAEIIHADSGFNHAEDCFFEFYTDGVELGIEGKVQAVSSYRKHDTGLQRAVQL